MKFHLPRQLPRETGVAVALLFVFAYFSFQAPNFATSGNLLTLARQYSEVALVSVGMTYVILIGGIDLSVGSIAGLAGMLAGMIARQGAASVIPAGLVALGIGLAIGAFNGALISFVQLSPVIVTLATWAGARSLAYVLTHGDPVSRLPDTLVALADRWLFGFIPLTAVAAALVALAASLTLQKTAYGRSLIAQGENQKAAFFSGVRVGRLGWSVYALTGLLAGVAGLLMTSRAATAVPDAGTGLEFEAITAVVLGGGEDQRRLRFGAGHDPRRGDPGHAAQRL